MSAAFHSPQKFVSLVRTSGLGWRSYVHDGFLSSGLSFGTEVVAAVVQRAATVAADGLPAMAKRVSKSEERDFIDSIDFTVLTSRRGSAVTHTELHCGILGKCGYVVPTMIS